MKTEKGIHSNCSEWDSEVESDDDTDYYLWRQAEAEKRKQEALKALNGWEA